MSATRTTSISANGVSAPVAEAGPADATEAVVFLHGNPASRHDWLALLEPVAEQTGRRAIAFDLPGYGEADKPKALPYTVEAYAAWLDGALKELGVERVHLVLHDWGGPIGLRWAADHPERVASVVAINAGGLSAAYRWHSFAKVLRAPLLGPFLSATSTRAGFRALMRRLQPMLPEAEIDRMSRLNDRRTRFAAMRLYRSVDDPGALPREIAPVLAPKDIPALVLWGDKDPFITPEHAERAKDLFPSAEIVHLAGSGHWPMLDDPAAVRERVVAFLAP